MATSSGAWRPVHPYNEQSYPDPTHLASSSRGRSETMAGTVAMKWGTRFTRTITRPSRRPCGLRRESRLTTVFEWMALIRPVADPIRSAAQGIGSDDCLGASDQRLDGGPSTGLTSSTGVPSTASIGPTRREPGAVCVTVTGWMPIGLGRCGDRVLKTPVSGFASPRAGAPAAHRVAPGRARSR
jgi:hypothetical protein